MPLVQIQYLAQLLLLVAVMEEQIMLLVALVVHQEVRVGMPLIVVLLFRVKEMLAATEMVLMLIMGVEVQAVEAQVLLVGMQFLVDTKQGRKQVMEEQDLFLQSQALQRSMQAEVVEERITPLG
jgi:hypothetical protein